MSKTTPLAKGWESQIDLIETSAIKPLVRKNYTHNPTLLTQEYSALVHLHNIGYSVPKPIKLEPDGIYMQHIENGNLWSIYEKSSIKQELIINFTKLLADLHALTLENPQPFIQTELSEIKALIETHQLTNYQATLNHLKTKSTKITESPPTYLHRDYHPWNVLQDKSGKLYTIDLLLKQGDYRFDVAWTYMLMKRTGKDEFAENFLTEYQNLSPLPDFEFFKQLANLRWLVNVRPGEMSEKPESFQHWIKQAEKECAS